MPVWMIILILVGLPILGIFAIPLLAIWTHHRRKMEEMALQRQRIMSDDTRAEFAAVRAEIKALRDTTMQYDLSFDTSLHNLERRLSQMEQQTRFTSPADSGIAQNLYNR